MAKAGDKKRLETNTKKLQLLRAVIAAAVVQACRRCRMALLDDDQKSACLSYMLIPAMPRARTAKSTAPTRLQILHVVIRLVLRRSSAGNWTMMGFLLTMLIELVCYRALAQIAGAIATQLRMAGFRVMI